MNLSSSDPVDATSMSLEDTTPLDSERDGQQDDFADAGDSDDILHIMESSNETIDSSAGSQKSPEMQDKLEENASTASHAEPEERNVTDPVELRDTGSVQIRTETSIRFLILPLATIFIAIVLASFTIAFGGSSFSTDIISNSTFFPYDPGRALLVLQLLATVSLLVIREAFVMCCELLRWSLATKGISFLTFIAMSEATGFWTLLQLLAVRKGRIWAPWRAFAAYKLFVVYMVLVLGQFVWLLTLTTRPAFKIIGHGEAMSSSTPYFSLDVNGLPFPFSRLEAWNFLEETTEIMQIAPSVCSPETDVHCAAYVNPVNPFYALDPDVPGTDGPMFDIIYENPSYIVEFRSGSTFPIALDDIEDPWAYCNNHTTLTNASIRLCMGGNSRSSKEDSWIVNAGWLFCADIFSCVESGNDTIFTNVFTTTMFIKQANTLSIFSRDNASIVDVPSTGTAIPYSVNISQFFTAFSAPLMSDMPITVDDIQAYNVSGGLDLLYGSGKTANSTSAADQFVEAMIFEFLNGNSYPALELRSFLTYALVSNSWSSNVSVVHPFDKAIPTYALSLSAVSMPAFATVTFFTILSCLAILVILGINGPGCSFRNTRFAGNLNMTLRKALIETDKDTRQRIIETYFGVKIQVVQRSEDVGLEIVVVGETVRSDEI